MALSAHQPPFGRASKPSLAIVTAVTMTGTLGLHIFVPALPSVAADLRASPLAAQLTLTLFLCGLAIGQLVYGPLSDRLGRRPVLIASLTVYLLGLLLAIPAPSVEILIVARVLQSLGACGSLVLGRAIVRDVSTSEDAARKLGILITAMTLTPALAPAIGGAINGLYGWRAIFGLLAAIVATLLGIVVLTMAESRPPLAMGPSGAGKGSAARLLRSGKFRRYLAAGACSGTALYAFLSAAPFLFIEVLHRSSEEVGLYCLVVSIGLVGGTLVARALAGGMEIRRGARLGNLVCLAGALALLAFDRAGLLSVSTLVGSMVVFAIGIGIGGPNIVAGAMNVDPKAAGTASSLYGFTGMAIGAAFSLAVGLWHDGTALPLATILLIAVLVGLVALQRA